MTEDDYDYDLVYDRAKDDEMDQYTVILVVHHGASWSNHCEAVLKAAKALNLAITVTKTLDYMTSHLNTLYKVRTDLLERKGGLAKLDQLTYEAMQDIWLAEEESARRLALETFWHLKGTNND